MLKVSGRGLAQLSVCDPEPAEGACPELVEGEQLLRVSPVKSFLKDETGNFQLTDS